MILVEVHAAKQSKDRIDDILYKRGYDVGKCPTDNDTDCHVHNVSTADKFFEFLDKFLHVYPCLSRLRNKIHTS